MASKRSTDSARQLMNINKLINIRYNWAMPAPLSLQLTEQEREALTWMRDHHHKGYARERAAALLKIADGASATQVANTGLLKRRYPHAVCEWVRRYRVEGMQG